MSISTSVELQDEALKPPEPLARQVRDESHVGGEPDAAPVLAAQYHPEGVGRVVRRAEGLDPHAADVKGEAHLDFLPAGRFAYRPQARLVGALVRPEGQAPPSRQGARASDVIDVLVREHDGEQILRAEAVGFEALRDLARAEARVHEKRGAARSHQRGVPPAPAAQNSDFHGLSSRRQVFIHPPGAALSPASRRPSRGRAFSSRGASGENLVDAAADVMQGGLVGFLDEAGVLRRDAGGESRGAGGRPA